MFLIRKVLKRGIDHNLSCEDSLCFVEHNGYYFPAVFDGCSTGINSYFASELMSKIFKKIINELPYEIAYLDIAKHIIGKMQSYLRSFQLFFNIEQAELLSTMIFGVLDVTNDKGYIVFIGDGMATINNEIVIIDQNNTPDYLAYYLDLKISLDDFWINHCKVKMFSKIEDISIASDGILSYQRKYQNEAGIFTIDNSQVPSEIAIKSLCQNNDLIKSEVMLPRKHNILERDGYFHSDDVSIVRIIQVADEN